jgi:hypothetical protein
MEEGDIYIRTEHALFEFAKYIVIIIDYNPRTTRVTYRKFDLDRSAHYVVAMSFEAFERCFEKIYN